MTLLTGIAVMLGAFCALSLFAIAWVMVIDYIMDKVGL